MNMWMIASIIVGVLVLVAGAAMALDNKSARDGCSCGCTGNCNCSAGENCGNSSCHALAGESCGCSKRA